MVLHPASGCPGPPSGTPDAVPAVDDQGDAEPGHDEAGVSRRASRSTSAKVQ
jgi:hypothetical protein